MLYCLKCKRLSDTKRTESRPDEQGWVTVKSVCVKCGKVVARFKRPTRRPMPEPCG